MGRNIQAEVDAKIAAKKSEYMAGQQQAQAGEALDYAKGQDAQKLGYASDWYNNQQQLADAEDARRFGLLPQFMDNATSAFDESLTNADDYYNQMVGNADEYSGQVLGDAEQYRSDIMDNARFTEGDYLDEEGRASADVVQAFDKARGMTRRNQLAYGIDPNSSAFMNGQAGSDMAQAGAEVNAINSGRREMRNTERDRTGRALTAGYGAVDNATRYGGNLKTNAYAAGYGAKDNATRYGRGMVANALNTNLNTRSSKIGLVDPRTGLTSMTLNQMNNNIGTTGQQANMYNNQAQQAQAAASAGDGDLLSDVIGAGAQVAGAYFGGPAGAAAARGLTSGGSNSGGGYAYNPPANANYYPEWNDLGNG